VQTRQAHLEEVLNIKMNSPVGRTRILLALGFYHARYNCFGVRRLTSFSNTTSPAG
jgi:hypothetical protein